MTAEWSVWRDFPEFGCWGAGSPRAKLAKLDEETTSREPRRFLTTSYSYRVMNSCGVWCGGSRGNGGGCS